ncbi:MAG: TldD/PmbA family protein [Paracoccaceae bacterium]
MDSKLVDLTNKLLKESQKAGAHAADVITIRDTSTSVNVLNGSIEKTERSETLKIGLRVIINNKQVCVESSLLDDFSLQESARKAVAMANEVVGDPFIGLASKEQIASDEKIETLELSESQQEPKIESLENLALRTENSALKIKGVIKTQSASAFYTKRELYLSATNGFSGGYSKTLNGLFCDAIVGTGAQMERDSFGDTRTHRSDLFSPETVGGKAGIRARKRENPRKPKTGYYPVLFDKRISSSLVSHLLTAVDGTSITQGTSWARNLLGKPILPTNLSLIENPRKKRSFASRPFDVEGLESKKRNIVKNGTLESWTLDLATARKLNLKSTANASRGAASPPRPSITNTVLTGGNNTFKDLVQKMHAGLLVTSMIGLTINQNTGDYSRGISGFWVEDGEVKYPVNECTIAGNLKEIFSFILAGNDAEPYKNISTPSLLIEGMTIAGK